MGGESPRYREAVVRDRGGWISASAEDYRDRYRVVAACPRRARRERMHARHEHTLEVLAGLVRLDFLRDGTVRLGVVTVDAEALVSEPFAIYRH